ncbi:DUSAM domain-containing protein [Archangium lipolyticum]|uniref:DUSAM domain-containing protein n=1 Tax=Archangium lipolyticum TaxID=2970465 RepID=UPI00214A6B18|nr:DUSAM domain-containing protein [Archangium lipolyticum]
MGEPHDWDGVLGLYARLERNEPIELNTDVLDLCRRVARDVAVNHDEAERALLTQVGAETLVREMRRRIFEGSRRLSRALVDSARHKRAGDVARARAVLDGVLAVEVVPLYREQAQIALDYVDEPEDVDDPED